MLNSCSIVARDPATTAPPGRLQADIRIHQLGALGAFCQEGVANPILGPDGQPLGGLSVDLYAKNQIVADPTPVAGYVNPLGITDANQLFITREYPVAFYQPATISENFTGRDVVWSAGAGDFNLDNPVSLTVSNPNNVAGYYRRTIQLRNWSIIDPPYPATVEGLSVPLPATVDIVTGVGTATLTNADVDTVTSPQAVVGLWVDVNGTDVLIGEVPSGGSFGSSWSYDLSDVVLAAGQTHATTMQLFLRARDPARIPSASRSFSVFPGLLEYSAQLFMGDETTGLTVTPTI